MSSRLATTVSENMATMLTDYAAATWWGELCGAKIQENFIGSRKYFLESRKYFLKQPFLESREVFSRSKKTGLMLQANMTLGEEKKSSCFKEKCVNPKHFLMTRKSFFFCISVVTRIVNFIRSHALNHRDFKICLEVMR